MSDKESTPREVEKAAKKACGWIARLNPDTTCQYCEQLDSKMNYSMTPMLVHTCVAGKFKTSLKSTCDNFTRYTKPE